MRAALHSGHRISHLISEPLRRSKSINLVHPGFWHSGARPLISSAQTQLRPYELMLLAEDICQINIWSEKSIKNWFAPIFSDSSWESRVKTEVQIWTSNRGEKPLIAKDAENPQFSFAPIGNLVQEKLRDFCRKKIFHDKRYTLRVQNFDHFWTLPKNYRTDFVPVSCVPLVSSIRV